VFIGGLIQNTENNSRVGIPCLGDIPVLGFLFGRTVEGVGKSELIVLITPHVVDDHGELSHDAVEKTKKAEEHMTPAPQ